MVSVISTIGIALLAYYQPLAQSSIKQHYRTQLTTLEDQVGSIRRMSNTPSWSKANLLQYDRQMEAIQESCRNLANETERVQKVKQSGTFKRSINQAFMLCEDLVPVVKYSQVLHRVAHDYLLLSTGPWPAADSPTFQTRLEGTSTITNQTKLAMANIDYPQVSDPALAELAAGVNGAQKMTGQIRASVDTREFVNASTKSDELNQYLDRDHHNFASARLYFWNNTVQLTRLAQAITKLKIQFQ